MYKGYIYECGKNPCARIIAINLSVRGSGMIPATQTLNDRYLDVSDVERTPHSSK